MSLISLASSKSLYRGYDYYKSGNVTLFLKKSECEYTARVKGHGNAIYNVNINIEHPRSSKCNCPFADGTRKICKHMVALCFKVCPAELKQYEWELEEAKKAEQEEEERLFELDRHLIKHLKGMTKRELEDALYDIFSHMIDEGNEWAVENFINGYGYYDEDEDEYR